jgi:hypothetical protein
MSISKTDDKFCHNIELIILRSDIYIFINLFMYEPHFSIKNETKRKIFHYFPI